MAQPDAGVPWVRALLWAALACGVWVAWQWGRVAPADDRLPQAVAASVKPGDLMMYATADCPHCARARRWLARQGLPFTECRVDTRQDCADGLRAQGASGVPALVVRGRPLPEGFDPQALRAALEP